MARKTRTLAIEGLGELELRVPTVARYQNIMSRFSRPHQEDMLAARFMEACLSRRDFARLAQFVQERPERSEGVTEEIVRVILGSMNLPPEAR